jgi:hypothetical protein
MIPRPFRGMDALSRFLLGGVENQGYQKGRKIGEAWGGRREGRTDRKGKIRLMEMSALLGRLQQIQVL